MESNKIPNPKYYIVLINGRVWSRKSKRLLVQTNVNGYMNVHIDNKMYAAHRLVALTYLENPKNKPYVNHKNCDKLDNWIDNLEWCTQKENCNDHGKVTSHAKQVIQMDLKGNFIQIHNSVTQAGQNTISLTAKTKNIGVDRSTIKRACTGEQLTAGGYKWAYVNKKDMPIKIDISKGKPIPNYPKYIAFRNGVIVSVRKKNTYLLKPQGNDNGHDYITLCKNNDKKNTYINQIIAETFIPNNDKNKTRVIHKNRIKNDNRVENLEWVSPGNTAKYANRSS